MRGHYSKWIAALISVAMVALLAGGLLLAAEARAQESALDEPEVARLHPPVPLLDVDGDPVIESGQPISTMITCGDCHDTAFIASHSVHVDAGASLLGTVETDRPWQTGIGWYGGWNPISYVQPSEMELEDWLRDYGWRHVGGGPAADADMEMNCFTCHALPAGNAGRLEALAQEQFAWLTTASLVHTEIVTADGDDWIYNEDAFDERGAVSPATLTLGAPTNGNCASCHGVASADAATPLAFDPTDPDQWHTQTTGVVFASGRINVSGMNVNGKADLNRPWDVHAERVVGCVDCHYSLNNPVFYVESEEGRPDHLAFDPRRMDFEDFLTRPLHQFANGGGDYASAFPVFERASRDCASCHDAQSTHTWLAYPDQHMEAVACQTCHIPALQAPALSSIDWTSVDVDGQPLRSYRGLDDATTPALLTGYTPVVLANDDNQLAPFNLVSAWYWVAGDPAEPVALDDLKRVYRNSDVRRAFDADGDGELSETERFLDSDEKVSIVTETLIELGYADPRIFGETEARPVNHSVINGEWATRECAACHQSDSRLAAPIILSGQVPGGVQPTFIGREVSGMLGTTPDGALAFTPQPTLEPVGLYIFGRDAVAWIDRLGVGLVLAVMGGVVIHGGLRVVLSRRLTETTHVETREEYLYSVYERQWHWLQSAVIFGLLFTGLVIHKPELFPLFQFRWLVLLHNAFAWVLIVNAALAAFYHLASGEIRQFIPEPRGFFGQMFSQARYYAYGIFRGEPHPIEKSRQRKMNPIQQVTYLALLNVLLPLQVITGLLMWGAGYVPRLVTALGGLPVIAPVHALCSWLMAAFIILHVYMTTTGHTPLANIRAMMFGWDEIEEHPTAQAGD
jgi:thiosulfate reductase cytochrome b subunit